MTLQIKDLAKTYPNNGPTRPVLDSLELTIETGTFVSVIGPSGCGKSTLCNLIAGLENPDRGEIILNGIPIQGSTGHVGYMPQKDLLLPWRSLLENLTLGSEISGRNRAEARHEALALLNQFGLAEFADYYPHQLSGGMRQRGAFLRTLLFGADFLLLDEPFGALDALTRQEMQRWLLKVWQQTQPTVLLITHDIDEAILLSDRIIAVSHQPAQIIKEIPIPFFRPRSPELLLTSEALSIKKGLLKLWD